MQQCQNIGTASPSSDSDHASVFLCVVTAIPALFEKKLQNQEAEEGSAVTLHAELSKLDEPMR